MQWALTILSCRPMTAELLIWIPVVTPPAGGRAHFLKFCSLTEAKLWFTICFIATSHSWMCNKTTFSVMLTVKAVGAYDAECKHLYNTCVFKLKGVMNSQQVTRFQFSRVWSSDRSLEPQPGHIKHVHRRAVPVSEKVRTQKSVISHTFLGFFLNTVKICANDIQYVVVTWGNLFPKCGSQSPGGTRRYCRWEVR